MEGESRRGRIVRRNVGVERSQGMEEGGGRIQQGSGLDSLAQERDQWQRKARRVKISHSLKSEMSAGTSTRLEQPKRGRGKRSSKMTVK